MGGYGVPEPLDRLNNVRKDGSIVQCGHTPNVFDEDDFGFEALCGPEHGRVQTISRIVQLPRPVRKPLAWRAAHHHVNVDVFTTPLCYLIHCGSCAQIQLDGH